MPKTAEYTQAVELEARIDNLLLEIFDAYGDEAKLEVLQIALAQARRELSFLRTASLSEAA